MRENWALTSSCSTTLSEPLFHSVHLFSIPSIQSGSKMPKRRARSKPAKVSAEDAENESGGGLAVPQENRDRYAFFVNIFCPSFL